MFFSSSETDNFKYTVSKTGDCKRELSLLTKDDFSNVNETRIKVFSSYLSGHVVVRCPEDKKTHQWSKTLL